jgi:hypothetical protein
MNEIVWLEAIIWLVLLLVGLKTRNAMVLGSAGSIGILFGLSLIAEADWLGVMLIILSLYLLYEAIASDKGGKK